MSLGVVSSEVPKTQQAIFLHLLVDQDVSSAPRLPAVMLPAVLFMN